ncbi:Nramp family divalent metal transporter [Actinomycetes bacterium KLBMP 9759]
MAKPTSGGFTLSTKILPPAEVRELPEPPHQTWKIIGPGVVGAGVGLASGEFILWPYIATQIGLAFLWGAVLGVFTQWFINMEIERYTLATGETALTGFSRMWRHWGLVFVVMTYFANLWPGWVTSSATLLTFLFGGGSANLIAVIMLVVIGISLTLAPVIYNAVERIIFIKVAAIVLFVVIAAFAAISASTWVDLSSAVTTFGQVPTELGWSLVLGAVVFAGAGGGQNLCQSNWIRDKGFGMGAHIPRLVSPVTGHEEAAPSTGYVFELTETNMDRWKRWWKFANWEQMLTVPLITIVTITFMSMLAASTVQGREGLSNSIAFLRVEAEALGTTVGPWFGAFFLIIGAFSLFAAAIGIVDYTSRLAADQLKTVYFRSSAVSENKIYFALVWGLVVLGILVLLVGLDQPLVLLVLSACVGGVMMFVYSILLLILNRTALPGPLKVKSYRIAALIWSILLFGVLSVITVFEQGAKLFGGS